MRSRSVPTSPRNSLTSPRNALMSCCTPRIEGEDHARDRDTHTSERDTHRHDGNDFRVHASSNFLAPRHARTPQSEPIALAHAIDRPASWSPSNARMQE